MSTTEAARPPVVMPNPADTASPPPAVRPGPEPPPGHLELPETDGSIVEDYSEFPQVVILTEAIKPVLDRLHPDGQYLIGANSGIYWRNVIPPLAGCKSPDWFYVPGASPQPDDAPYRRSYVLWNEVLPPLIVIEFVSGDGSEERDRTPWSGKFWVYENAIRPVYYAIYEPDPGRVEVFERVGGRFEPMTPNERGHFPIAEVEAELGIWRGQVINFTVPWLRWFDPEGRLLPSGSEAAEQERGRAEQERLRAERLASQLRSLGVEPEA
jgi:Uma2 family endonuclease